MGITACGADFADSDADRLTGRGHEHELVGLFDRECANERSGFVRDFHRDDAFSAAGLFTVFLKVGAFAEAIFRSDEQGVTFLNECEADHIIAFDRTDTHHAL